MVNFEKIEEKVRIQNIQNHLKWFFLNKLKINDQLLYPFTNHISLKEITFLNRQVYLKFIVD